MRILHLEDSSPDAELIAALLEREWPACAVRRVETRAQFLAALEVGDFDVILSDYTMGNFDGLAALELARVWCPEKPFIFLSGTIGEERAVEALKRGAMDYVIKDRPSRLIPAIRQAVARVEEGRQHRMTAEALRQNRERFREITENVADLIVLLDLDGRRLYHNPAYAKALGEPGELIGTSFFANVHPDDRSRTWDGFMELVHTGDSHQSEYRIVRQDGAVRYIESHDSVIRDKDGLITLALIVARDVTERRAAEARIREQADLLDKAQDAILVRDLNHRISYWNRGAERLYGWSAAEAQEQSAIKLFQTESDVLEVAREETLVHGEWLGEMRHHTKAGGEVTVQSRWTLMRGPDGSPTGFLSINTDITEKLRLEAHLLRAQRLESMGMLVSSIAHDLNNVLAPILMSVGVLKLNANDSTKKLVGAVEGAAQQGAGMVRQLLSFARGASGAHANNVDLGSLLGEFEKLIRPSIPARIVFEIKIQGEPPPIRADPTQVKQVLMNLCLNARDAIAGEGRITLALDHIRLEQTDTLAQIKAVKPGPYAVLIAEDTGAGIPPELLDRIFDPFFTTKGEGKGSGLGLSTVRGIVKGHGGFLTVESEVRRGTTFRIYLPTAPAAPALAAAAPSADRVPGILLVDDEPMIRSALEMVLTDAGYRVFTAGGAKEALLIFEDRRPELQLVITDIWLADSGGLEFINTLRAIDPRCRIVAISGVAKTGQYEAELTAANVPLLPKPIRGEVLLTAVRTALSTAGGRGVPVS